MADEPAIQPVKVSILTPEERPVSLEQFEKLATGAKVTRTEDPEGFIRLTAEWGETVVNVNFKPDHDREVQNEGALGFVSRFPKEDRETPEAKKLVEFIPSIRQTYGVVLPRGFDPQGNASALLRSLAKHLDGYLISNSSFYDSRGFRILGHPLDSPFLGLAGRNLSYLEKPLPATELLAGSWDVNLAFRNVDEDGTLEMWLESVDVFDANGSHHSSGSIEIGITPPDSDERLAMSLDFEIAGRWEEKDGGIVIHTEKATAANLHSELEESKEFLEEIAAEINKTNETDFNWLIARDLNRILLEDNKVGVTVQMKRKVLPQAPADSGETE